MSLPVYSCLWFEGKAKEAANFYCGLFKESKILSENPFVLVIELNGAKLMCLNG
ncbi:MAG: VOC family protein [bacterium]|nr:VOC family protein [bacterium]